MNVLAKTLWSLAGPVTSDSPTAITLVSDQHCQFWVRRLGVKAIMTSLDAMKAPVNASGRLKLKISKGRHAADNVRDGPYVSKLASE